MADVAEEALKEKIVAQGNRVRGIKEAAPVDQVRLGIPGVQKQRKLENRWLCYV